MKNILIGFIIVIGLLGYGHAQTSDQGKRSDEIVMRMRQIDLLTQIIPLALTKDQINQILPTIERARAKAKQIEKTEAETLLKLDGKISDAIKKAIEDSVAPPKELLDELARTTAAMSMIRMAAVDDNIDAVMKVFNDVCNAGQKKAAANSLAPQLIDPSLKPDKMTQDDKIRFFIQNILLDGQSYEILVQLAKHAS
ncbi:MAG: hypothetical protein ACHQ50_04770 [Fimbriimonadales bacterium]